MIFVINSAGECTRFFCHIAVLAGVALWLSEVVRFIMDAYSRGGVLLLCMEGLLDKPPRISHEKSTEDRYTPWGLSLTVQEFCMILHESDV